jgi:outer membrane protein assembly factor BamB
LAVNISLLLLLSLAGAEGDARWPGFLGAGRTEVAAETLPLAWSPEKNIAWKADLPGHGQSSPIVWGERVFVTAVEGPMKDTYHVLAFGLADGKTLWRHSLESSDKVKDSNYVSRAAPTPMTDGRAVYAFFESGDLITLSLDGKELWRRSLSSDYGKFQNEFGLAASPVLTDDAVILLIDHDGPSYVTPKRKKSAGTI